MSEVIGHLYFPDGRGGQIAVSLNHFKSINSGHVVHIIAGGNDAFKITNGGANYSV